MKYFYKFIFWNEQEIILKNSLVWQAWINSKVKFDIN